MIILMRSEGGRGSEKPWEDGISLKHVRHFSLHWERGGCGESDVSKPARGWGAMQPEFSKRCEWTIPVRMRMRLNLAITAGSYVVLVIDIELCIR
jgi:hypothetical protein